MKLSPRAKATTALGLALGWVGLALALFAESVTVLCATVGVLALLLIIVVLDKEK